MIFSRTILTVRDNSGAKYVKALSLWGNAYRTYGRLGDTMLVVPKKLRRRMKRAKSMVQKRKKYVGLIISTVWNTRRRDGSFIKFLKSTTVLFSLKYKLLGTALKIPLSKEFKAISGLDSGDIKKLVTTTRIFI